MLITKFSYYGIFSLRLVTHHRWKLATEISYKTTEPFDESSIQRVLKSYSIEPDVIDISC